MVAMQQMKANIATLLCCSIINVIHDIQGVTMHRVLDNHSVHCGLKDSLMYTLHFQKECQLVNWNRLMWLHSNKCIAKTNFFSKIPFHEDRTITVPRYGNITVVMGSNMLLMVGRFCWETKNSSRKWLLCYRWNQI